MKLALDADALASQLLVADVYLARRIVAHQNRGQARPHARLTDEFRHVGSKILLNRGGQRLAIQ
jgi:hypothetical protein